MLRLRPPDDEFGGNSSINPPAHNGHVNSYSTHTKKEKKSKLNSIWLLNELRASRTHKHIKSRMLLCICIFLWQHLDVNHIFDFAYKSHLCEQLLNTRITHRRYILDFNIAHMTKEPLRWLYNNTFSHFAITYSVVRSFTLNQFMRKWKQLRLFLGPIYVKLYTISTNSPSALAFLFVQEECWNWGSFVSVWVCVCVHAYVVQQHTISIYKSSCGARDSDTPELLFASLV